MIEFVSGDIFDTVADIRVNTVNCVGVMGAGVALAFKKRYPQMFKDYQVACKAGQVKPGKMHIWKSLEGVWIINFPTKRDWREPSRYEDVDAGLDDLRLYLDSVGPVTVALPALGCGNGGLDWVRVSDMIRRKLDGVNAHVFVLEPSASSRAGKNAVSTTEEERKEAEELGYKLVRDEQLLALKSSKPVYIMGALETLSHKWITVLPSRSPSEREFNALRAISIELASLKADVSVALVHGTKASEEIADIFARQGIKTILFLPFGVLTRKTLAKKVALYKSGNLTLASIAGANEKWSRQLYGKSLDLIRLNASSVLLSDPEPDWLLSKEMNRWEHAAFSFVRYELTPPSVREALEGFGAKPIGRRGDTGAPNIDYLSAAFVDFKKREVSATDLVKIKDKSFVLESPLVADKDCFAQSTSNIFSMNVHQESQEKLRLLFELVLSVGLEEVILKLPVGASEEDRRRLVDIGFNQSKNFA
ncbi:macro domain-containing protein [Pseudomonas canadensis]|uniref:macro domain-containing protein n=1 Tax=Pseudomonas canadensis TaxID=915099 RepID=UPI003369C970